MTHMKNLALLISSVWLTSFLVSSLCGCSSSVEKTKEDCTKPLFDCLDAQGDCVLSKSDDGKVSVHWESGASVSGPVGLAVFEAMGPNGQNCFSRKTEGNDIILTNGNDTFRITPAASGGISVTCADGSVQEYEAGQGPYDEVGVDSQRLTTCRISGICSSDDDCLSNQVCCSGQCHDGQRCPGTCEVDEHCGEGNICCDGFCTSLPSCQMVCSNDLQCDDGVFCNGREYCSAGLCQVALSVMCDDSVACTDDVCDEGNKACTNDPDDSLCGPSQRCNPEKGCEDIVSCSTDDQCDDGDECTIDKCQSDICENTLVVDCCHVDADCDDGNFCNGAEKCDSGSCTAGGPPDCDDGIDCTLDQCDTERNSCIHLSDQSKCEADEVCDPESGCVPSAQCGVDGNEPNDTLDKATPLHNKEGVAGTTCLGDEDWFVFEMVTEVMIMTIVSVDTDMGMAEVQMQCCDGTTPDSSLSHPEEGQFLFQCIGCGTGQELEIRIFGQTPDTMVDYGLLVVVE